MANSPNRLDLDFSIEDRKSRNEFLRSYIERPEFKR
jgi:hypothetical protein